MLDDRESTLDDVRPFVEAGVRKGHALVVIKADRKVPCGLVQKVAKAATSVEGVAVLLGVQDKKWSRRGPPASVARRARLTKRS